VPQSSLFASMQLPSNNPVEFFVRSCYFGS
jgi:hypothetical protein